MGKVKGVAAKNQPELTVDQLKRLALLERNSFQVYQKECELCGAQPDNSLGFSWAFVVVIGDDGALDADEKYVVRYEFLSSEKEVMYSDMSGKKVNITFESHFY